MWTQHSERRTEAVYPQSVWLHSPSPVSFANPRASPKSPSRDYPRLTRSGLLGLQTSQTHPRAAEMNDHNAGGFAYGQPQPGIAALAHDQQQDEFGSGPAEANSGLTPGGEHGSSLPAFSNPADQTPLFGAGNANVQFQPLTEEMVQSVPALDFNGFILHAQKPVPEELQRDSSGASILEPDAVLDEENGRTYHNYHEGRYYLPNDAVCDQ